MCQVPQDPGPDPAYGGHPETKEDYSVNTGYSGEDKRANIFSELISMALACDLTRSISFMLTMAQSRMNLFDVIGAKTTVHEVGHQGDGGFDYEGGLRIFALADSVAWHVKHFARLVKLLRDMPEGSGSVLDNTVVILLFEGGHGYDSADGSYSTHSTENMAALVAGGTGTLKSGVHLPMNHQAHPAQVLISGMKAVGVDSDLGEVTGHLPEMFI